MKPLQSDLIILGAGLTGLTIAYLLRQKGLKISIIEARERLGGRIYTQYTNTLAPQEMGATWLGQKHTALVALLEELGIGVFEQTLSDRAIYEPISTSPPQLVALPPNDQPSYRIQGGTGTLIQALAAKLKHTEIYTNQMVQSVEKQGDMLIVCSKKQTYKAPQVISTLPPYLLQETISITPELPRNLLDIMDNTHTWMGESIKIALNYKTAFWRSPQLSGTIFSSVGPIPEMYDHSDYEDQRFGLKGFLNGAYFSLKKAERLELIMQQLEKYFGVQARQFKTYEETVWRKENFTFAPYKKHVLPHQNNGHLLYQQAYLDGRFYIAGSETATYSPGYMEGAVRSANFVCSQLGNIKALNY